MGKLIYQRSEASVVSAAETNLIEERKRTEIPRVESVRIRHLDAELPTESPLDDGT